jgi:hypothetical protein
LNWLNGIEIRFFRRLFDGWKIRSRRLWLRQLSGVLGSRLLGHYIPPGTNSSRYGQRQSIPPHTATWI